MPRTSEIELSDKKYTFTELTEDDIVKLDEWVQSKFINNARNSIPDDLVNTDEWDKVVALAMRESLSLTWNRQPGINLIFNTKDGLARLIWQSLRAAQPKLTHSETRDLLKSVRDKTTALDEFCRLNDLKITKRQQSEEANSTTSP